MTITNPRVTVYTCVYNAAPYLRESIESILGQAFGDFEFIIIDDGSTDSSLEIARSYQDERLLVHSQDHKGIVRSRNRALRMARGQYIAVQDADDVSLRERVAREVQVLEELDDIVLVGTGVTIIDERGNALRSFIPPADHHALVEMLLRLENPLAHSTCMFRREVALAVGGYDELFRKAEDYALIMRLANSGNLKAIREPHVLLRHLLHSETFGDHVGEQLMYALLARALVVPELVQVLGDSDAWLAFSRELERWFLTSGWQRRFSGARLRRAAQLQWRGGNHARAIKSALVSLFLEPQWIVGRLLGAPMHLWNRKTETELIRLAEVCAARRKSTAPH